MVGSRGFGFERQVVKMPKRDGMAGRVGFYDICDLLLSLSNCLSAPEIKSGQGGYVLREICEYDK